MTAPGARIWMSTFVISLVVSSAVFGEFTVTVTGGKHGVPVAVVTAELPDTLVGKNLALADEKGAGVPVQADTKAGKPAFTFLACDLGAGRSRTYTLSEADGTPPTTVGVEVAEVEAGADVKIDGEAFTTYQTHNGPKPYLWPILGPTQKPMTRSWPMQEQKGEVHDHVHHRGLWFTFDRVNGENFWIENPMGAKCVHNQFVSLTSGPVFGEIIAKVDWMASYGPKIAEDTRVYRFYRVPEARLIDFSISMTSTMGPLKFGDSKEGLFAIRVAESMKVDGKGGRIINSAGDEDGKTWGKRAEWCDYFGNVDGDIVGVAIFDAPTNFRHPTYWHVRTYGLFAANPFGISYFTGDKSQDGKHEVPEGKSFDATYRVYMHKGDTQAAKVADWYAAFADPPNVVVR